jgi:hypothetical protein
MRILAPDRIKALAEHLPLIKVRTENIRFFKDQNIFVFEVKKNISKKTVQNSLVMYLLKKVLGTVQLDVSG